MSKNLAKVEAFIPVTPITQADGSHWLQIRIPDGWDDVKKIHKKVLSFEGRFYTFRSWNSDSYLCHFREDKNFATVV
jgi:hypothetical protein